MAVAQKIVLLSSDISGIVAEDVETVTIEASTIKLPKIVLDLTTEEREDENGEMIESERETLIAVHAEMVDAINELVEESIGFYLNKMNALRAAGAQTTGGAANKASAGRKSLDPVRAWARLNGYQVGDRGVIKAEIHAAYKAANGGAVTNLDTAPPAESWDNSVAGDGDVVTTDGPTADDLAAIEAEANA